MGEEQAQGTGLDRAERRPVPRRRWATYHPAGPGGPTKGLKLMPVGWKATGGSSRVDALGDDTCTSRIVL